MTTTYDHQAKTERTEPPLALADGVELIGEFQGSGYKEPPSLARLANGQTVQLTELLYVVLTAIDGRRDLDAIAGVVSEQYGKTASAEDIGYLAEEKLRPLGLLKQPDGSEPKLAKPDQLLGIRGRFTLLDATQTQRLTGPFAALFTPLVVVAVVAAFAAMTWWLFFHEGIGGATRSLLFSPGMLVLTFALTATSAAFHEFGHAAGCRYGGAKPGVIGGGVYLVWPVFFTDVTDSYRLDRASRLRVDLGGLYFNMLFALATLGMWAATRYDPLLVLVPLQLLQMTHQLMPFVRLDGYYILADVTGVPDLFARIKPTLKSALPGEDDQRAEALRPWVRVVVTAWVLAVVPVIAAMLVFAVIGLPRLLATVASSATRQWGNVTDAAAEGEYLAVIAGALGTFAVVLPAASILFVLGRAGWRVSRWSWRRTEGNAVARAALGPVAIAGALGLAWLWWPNGEYQPLQRGERWTVQETFSRVREVPSGRPGAGTAPAGAGGTEDEAPATTTTIAPASTTTPAPDDENTDEGTDDESTERSTTTTEPESPVTEDTTETTTP